MITRSYGNYYTKLEDQSNDMVKKDTKPDFKQLYYEYMNEIKISHNYVCKQLDSIKECYNIEKMTTQALESMIEWLVED